TDAETTLASTTYSLQLYEPTGDAVRAVGEPEDDPVDPVDPERALDHQLAHLRRVVDGKLSAERFAALRANLHDRERTQAALPAELAATAIARHPAYEAP